MSFRTLSAAALTLAFASVSQAALINETFTYPDGTIAGRDPAEGGVWAVHSGAGGLAANVVSNQLVIAQGSGSREDVNLSFAGGETGSAGEIYTASFDLSVADPGATITDVYFAHFLITATTFQTRTFITAPTTSGYRLAVGGDGNITDNDGEVRTADLAFGQTYNVTLTYDYDSGDSSIAINGGPALTTTDGTFSDAIVGFAFRQAAGNTTQTIDNLVVTVPEPTTIAAGLAAMGLIARRRRA